MATLIGRGATASAAVRSTISTPNGEERLFVNLTQAYDGRPDSPDRRVSFVLPAAHTPKPLSAARRHIKPPDPVPLNSIQAAETSTPTTPQRRISGWGDDVELIEGCKVVWNEDTRPRSTGAGSAGGGTRHGEAVQKGKNDHHTAKEGRPPKDHHPNGSKGQYEPCPNNPALLQRSEARAASGAISPSPQLAITGTRSGSSTRPSSASVHPPHHATPSTHTPHATTTPHHPHPHAHSLHRRTPAAPQPQTDTIVPPTPHPPHHHTPSTTPGAVALPPHHPPGSTRVQTARTNLDRYRIEQIALRRLRFVVENNQAEQEHLAMVDLVEQGHVPLFLLHKYFGPSFHDILDLRVLVLQAIDRTRMLRSQIPAFSSTTTPTTRPLTLFSARPHATTPDDVLNILDTVEKRMLRAAAGKEKKRKAAAAAVKLREEKSQPGARGEGQDDGGVVIEAVGTAVGESKKSMRDPATALSPHQILRMIDRRRQRHLTL